MAYLALIPLCIALGFFLRSTGWAPPSIAHRLNRFIILGPLPALTFCNIRAIQLDATALYPVSMAWLLFAGAVLFFRWLSRREKWNRQTLGAMILTGGLSNTSFIGFPVLYSLYGAEGLRIGVLVDQPGSFLVLSTLGLGTAALCSPGSSEGSRDADSPIMPGTRLLQVLIRIFSFPPLYALVLAIFLRSTPLPESVLAPLDAFGKLLAPLALLSIGLQWDPFILKSLRKGTREFRALMGCLAYKLVLGPAFIAALYLAVDRVLRAPSNPWATPWATPGTSPGIATLILQVTILEAAMAPMITGGIVAVEHDLDPPLVAMIIGAGIPVSILTVGIWAALVNFIQ